MSPNTPATRGDLRRYWQRYLAGMLVMVAFFFGTIWYVQSLNNRIQHEADVISRNVQKIKTLSAQAAQTCEQRTVIRAATRNLFLDAFKGQPITADDQRLLDEFKPIACAT